MTSDVSFEQVDFDPLQALESALEENAKYENERPQHNTSKQKNSLYSKTNTLLSSATEQTEATNNTHGFGVGISQLIQKLHQNISSASKSIYLSDGMLFGNSATKKTFFNLLNEKASEGVSVNLLIAKNIKKDDDKFAQITNFESKLAKAFHYNVNCDIVANDFLSHQFCVIDENKVFYYAYSSSEQTDIESNNQVAVTKLKNNIKSMVISSGDEFMVEQFIAQFKQIIVQTKLAHKNNSNTDTGSTDIPIAKIVKRLEILKNYIVLDELEDINRECEKLADYGSHSDIFQIVTSLSQLNYGDAVTAIELFIKKYSQIVPFDDVDVFALKLEIRHLENQLNAYDNEKVELHKLLAEFQNRHTNELGSYIVRLLHLRKLKYRNDPRKHAEAVQDETEYRQQINIESEKVIHQLDKQQRKELKKIYRKASQKCHPDRVNDDMKEIAQEAFVRLTQAYEQNDIVMVHKISREIEQGVFKAKSETISEKSQLQASIQALKLKIEQLGKEIDHIKCSDEYQTICDISDWSRYFESLKEQLQQEIFVFENQEIVF